MYHHKYSLSELMEMIPWEREVYVSMVIAEIQKAIDAAKK
jgi:hypothetical protein